jgi:hypothetical protein
MERSDISPLWAVTFGAAAGYALWFSVYPIDVIKSKIQTDSLIKGKTAYNGMVDCATKTWKNQGLKGFTNGLGPTLIRQVDTKLSSMFYKLTRLPVACFAIDLPSVRPSFNIHQRFATDILLYLCS